VGICVEHLAKKKTLKKTSLQFPAMKKSLYKRCEDSKVLSEAQRDSIYAELKQETLFQGTTAHISAKDIDRH
jgi:ribonuclease HII